MSSVMRVWTPPAPSLPPVAQVRLPFTAGPLRLQKMGCSPKDSETLSHPTSHHMVPLRPFS